MMVMRTYILFICSLLILRANSSCSRFFITLFSPCSFDYHISDTTNCSNFRFIKCTWRECSKYKQNSTQCSQQVTRYDSSWDYCMSRCCYSFKQYPYEYSSLEQCEQDMKQQTITLIVIALIIVGIMLIIAGLVFIFKCFKEKIQILFASKWLFQKRQCIRRCCKCLFRNQDTNYLANEQQMFDAINWQISQLPNQIKNKICGVCLKPGCTIKLDCEHLFHKNCAKQFLKLSDECYSCKQKCPYPTTVTIYCWKCQSTYFKAMLEEYQQQLQICQKCRLTGIPE